MRRAEGGSVEQPDGRSGANADLGAMECSEWSEMCVGTQAREAAQGATTRAGASGAAAGFFVRVRGKSLPFPHGVGRVPRATQALGQCGLVQRQGGGGGVDERRVDPVVVDVAAGH